MCNMLTRNEVIHQHKRNIDGITATLVAYRCFGDDKIKKPSLLKGLKPVKQFDLIGKKVNVFDLGNGDLVLYFGTLFSKIASFPDSEDIALPTSVLAKKYNFNKGNFKSFTYPDAWCTIYDRNEGYILVKGLLSCFKELYCLDVASISEKVYSCLRGLSTKDCRFMTLSIVPTGADSADYYRLCEDLVNWLYITERNKVEFNK